MFVFRKELIGQIMNSDNPIESLNKIEDVFIRNNIPVVGKVYSCFSILHPGFKGFDFNDSKVSPVLAKSSNRSKEIIVFSDLIKASFGSNNRSIRAYLDNIEIGYNLYNKIVNKEIDYDSLSDKDKEELITFSKHLFTLYNNTLKGKNEGNEFVLSSNVIENINELKRRLSPNGSLDYRLDDRVIKMFCGFAGINTLQEAKEYLKQKVYLADARNRKRSNTGVDIGKGDFVKGIGDITFLRNILQNGSVSKEYLGSSAKSDSTPLDTDVSMILEDKSMSDMINSTEASGYGSIWFVLKNDERFVTTRDKKGPIDVKRDLTKLEVFYTGVVGSGHYGIRTGFASSEIDYIIVNKYDNRVGLEIALNGFYIPVADKDGKIVFTPDDYDKLRSKMNGLSYYNSNEYIFSDNLVTEQTEYIASQVEESNIDVKVKRDKINRIISKSLEDVGLKLKTVIDGDLTSGYVELIDTGSTGRGTNNPGDGDFDFMMRLDKDIIASPGKLNELKESLLNNLGKNYSDGITSAGDFRLKDVLIDSETSVDIDITFTEKTDKVMYSTDMSLQDRLETIKASDPAKYKYVVANIIMAKKILKNVGAYKPNRGEVPQGGLGGVGIENWVLQNGGSFYDAAVSFLKEAEGKTFEEFKECYQVWDFGDNHLAERRGKYAHDNFVANNMSEQGFNKMVNALKEYLQKIEYEVDSIKK